MATLVHLSDLHLLSGANGQDVLLGSLVAALDAVEGGADLLAITGDVFDTSRLDPSVAIPRFRALHEQIASALAPRAAPGGPARRLTTVVLPGNHDRRRDGTIGPHDPTLFRALDEAMGAQIHVAGCRTPFLSELIPRAAHGLPAELAAYDSTFLPRGRFSAGGFARPADLLRLASQIGVGQEPLFLLMHHHLIPTPITDLVDIAGKGRLERAAITALGALFANAEHQELMMTALGAGTALSVLHEMRRAVVVLHGHKHYPTTRLLRATAGEHGDVLLTAAGSAGVVEAWNARPDVSGEAPSGLIWPSFNVVRLDGDELSVDTVSFSPAGPGRPPGVRRLVQAARRGARWEVRDLPASRPTGQELTLNDADFALSPNADRPGSLWDVRCLRRLRRAPGSTHEGYIDVIPSAAGGLLTEVTIGGRPGRAVRLPGMLPIAIDGDSSYRVVGGLARAVPEAVRAYRDPTAAFEWVGLLDRYGSAAARLALSGLPDPSEAFGSVTDLTVGWERPAAVRLDPATGAVVLELPSCPPRTLLRIYWPLEGAGPPACAWS